MIQPFSNQSSAHSDIVSPTSAPLDAHVVALTNFLGPHHCKQLQVCQQRVRRMTILVSTEMEPNRDWAPDWGCLDVQTQKNWTWTRKWRHRAGFTEDNYVHIPWDTGRQLRRLKPDVIFSYEMGMRTLLSAMYRAANPDCRLVMVCNVSEETEQGRGKMRSVLRNWLRRRVDLVTTNGPGCTRYLKSLGFPPERIVPFHYCHDAAKVWEGPKQFSSPPSRLFYCGSLAERKGIVPFCQALAKWCRANADRTIHLVMAGRGPLQQDIETMRRPANLNLELLGSVGAEAIRNCYQSCDITVFPTWADEWGLVTNESLASGTPILTSTRAQSTEVLCRDGENSWIFDPFDQTDLESALDRALNTPAHELESMSRAARKAVHNINPQTSSDEFYEIIRAAMASMSPAPDRIQSTDIQSPDDDPFPA